jgi:hypothetical protein
MRAMQKTLRNRKPVTTTPPPAEPQPAAPPKFTPRGSSKNRILIAVKDNAIDWPGMSQESSKQLNELMHQPEVQAQFGIGPLKAGFDPEHCKRIYEALGTVMMGFGKLAFKWPATALEKLQYTEKEKEELSKPTAAVLDEMAPKWLRENQALAALVLVFSAMTQNKLREAAMEAARVKAQSSGANGAGVPTAASGIEQPPTRMRVVVPIAGNPSEIPVAPPLEVSSIGGAQPRM